MSYFVGEFVIQTIQRSFGPLPASALHLWRMGLVLNGAWLLGESIYALAIAWLMPPVKSKGLSMRTPLQVVS